jgi:hypothetical protein
MRRMVLGLLMVGLLGGAAAAQAQNYAQSGDRSIRFHGLGPRVGFSISPNQFVFGGHADFGDPFPGMTWYVPVVEIGVGDHETFTSLGTDLIYRFRDRWGAWTPLVGGEVAFEIESVNNGGTGTDLGLMGLAGVEKGIGESNLVQFQIKFQIVDSPDVKFLVGWTFGH